ncbi:hypothetical protein EK904_001665 [Melospiza melodia maxima]|nr:hypothetical protein EK904_001665 [Melospiza melodia maxima]
MQTPNGLLLTPSPLLSSIHFWSSLSPVAPLSPARLQGPNTLFQSLAAQSEPTGQCLLQKAHIHGVKEREINAGPWREQVTAQSCRKRVQTSDLSGEGWNKDLGTPRQFGSHPVR